MSFLAVRTLAFVISSELTVNIDGSCSSFALLHEGHTGRSEARTSASNSLPQDRHRKSNSGMTPPQFLKCQRRPLRRASASTELTASSKHTSRRSHEGPKASMANELLFLLYSG